MADHHPSRRDRAGFQIQASEDEASKRHWRLAPIKREIRGHGEPREPPIRSQNFFTEHLGVSCITSLMQPKRYRFRQELNGTWTVFDVFTGLPVAFANEGAAIDYTKGEAEDVARLLNIHDNLKRGISFLPPKKKPSSGLKLRVQNRVTFPGCLRWV